MSFEKLISKVHQAEDALEARERQVTADVRQFKRSWRAAWTPGRIVVAGLAAGFVVGRSGPSGTATKGSSVMRMLSMLSTLLASTTAQSAAHQAGDAAEQVEDVAGDLGTAGATARVAAAGTRR